MFWSIKTTSNMALSDIKHLSLDDVFFTKRGSKICRVRCAGGDFVITPPEHLRIPFDASNYDKDGSACRLSLVFETNPELQTLIETFDGWIVRYMSEHSERIFKKTMTPEQVRVGYCSCLKYKEPYAPTLKCKLDKDGRRGICCWQPSGERADQPSDWRSVMAKPRLHVSHLWVMGAQHGVVIQLTDAEIVPSEVVQSVERANPFR